MYNNYSGSYNTDNNQAYFNYPNSNNNYEVNPGLNASSIIVGKNNKSSYNTNQSYNNKYSNSELNYTKENTATSSDSNLANLNNFYIR